MNHTTKTERLVARANKKTMELIHEASRLSGIPISEITRKGALNEAVQIISIFNGKVQQGTTSSQERNKNVKPR